MPAAVKPSLPSQLIQGEPQELESRGLSRATCRKYDYTCARMADTWVQVATYRDARGEPVAQKIRKPGKTFTWRGEAARARLFGEHLFPDGGRCLTITEGEIDCLSVSQAFDNRYPVVSLRSGASGAVEDIKRSLEFVESFSEVRLLFDNDEPGQKAAREVAELLSPGKALIATLPAKDPNELLVKRQVAKLVRAFWDAKPFQPDGVISAVEAWQHVLDRPSAISTPYGIQELDDMTEGHRAGEVVTVCAGTGVGKSTFVQEQMVRMVHAGHRVGYVALEEPVWRQALGLASVVMNKPLHRGGTEWDEETVGTVFREHFEDRVMFFDNRQFRLNSDALLSKLRWIIKGAGCDRVILDHLTILVSAEEKQDAGERKAIDTFMGRLVQLVAETRAGVFVISHLKRPNMGQGFENGRKVALSDLRGSSMIEALSDGVVALERDQQSEDPIEKLRTQVRVLKCRWSGETGPAGSLWWHADRNRLLPVEPGGAADFDG